MSHRINHARISRIVLFVCIVAAPAFGPGAVVVPVILSAALTGYEGLRRSVVYGITAAFVGIELVYGMDVGVLSVAYLCAALALMLVGRVVTVAPWSGSSGWHAADVVRTLCIAFGVAAVMALATPVVGHLLYGYGQTMTRLVTVFQVRDVALAALSIGVVLVVLRRTDEPFRRRIMFGM